MKICFVSPSVGTITGGSETIVHQFARYLGWEHDVTILTGRSRSKSMLKTHMDGPFQVITVPYLPRFTTINNLACKLLRRLTPYKVESFSFYYNVVLRSKIIKRIKDMDVISTHYWLDSRLFSNLAFRFGVPSVFHILGGPYPKEFLKADRSTLYVATSQYTQRIINDAHDFKIDDVVTPGIPSWLFSHQHKERDDKEKKLLFVGRLHKTKGLFELINIFSKLSKLNQDLSLTIVGEGDLKKELKELVRKRGLQKKIIITGQVPYNKIFDYYFDSTLFIFPSIMETFGIVPLEAMACELPVVALDIPCLKDSTGGNAVLLPPDDLDLWVETIAKLLEDEKQRSNLSARGIEWAKKFTWEKKAKEYEKTLQKAMDIFKKGME